MKPTNPMQQLQKWKENHIKQQTQQAVSGRQKFAKKTTKQAKSDKPKATPKPTTQNAQNVQQVADFGFFVLPQNTRNFQLMKDSVTRCKAEFPDHFHHKQQLAKECQQLSVSLNQGFAILQKLTKKQPLDDAEKVHLKNFKQAVNYLSHHFKDVQQHIKAVQDGSIQAETA